jgi:hypothetical protein
VAGPDQPIVIMASQPKCPRLPVHWR